MIPIAAIEEATAAFTAVAVAQSYDSEELAWLERTLTGVMRRLMDTENLDMPLLQLPLAQMRLAQSLYRENEMPGEPNLGETMGKLSERLNVRQNALTQAADRLVNHGLAERLSDPSDRRIVRLRLTTKGHTWVRERRSRRRARYEHLWELLSTSERQEFLQAVRVLDAAGNRLSAQPARNTELKSESHFDPPTVEETLSRFTDGEATLIDRT